MRPNPLPALLLATSALCLGPCAARAQSARRELPELAQELFVVETVYAQGKGQTQLTLHARVGEDLPYRALGEYGVSDRLQLSLQVAPGEWEEEGATSFEPEILYALLPATPIELSMALAAQLSRGDAPVWEPTVVAAGARGRAQLHGTLSAELTRGEATLSGGAALLVDAGRVTPGVEALWSTDEEPLMVPELFLHLAPGVEVGVGRGLCSSCDATARATHVMLTVEF